MRSVDESIEHGLAYLASQQLPTGAFVTYTWTDPPGVQSSRLDSCTFPTAVVARSLAYSPSAAAASSRAKAVAFLKREMEPGGLWRYWSSDNPGRGLIPPDLDDTVCASEVLRSHRVSIEDNRALILANRDSRGLFYTWVTPRARWNPSLQYWKTSLRQLRRIRTLRWFWKSGTARPDDVDCIVNVNVLMYLGRGTWTAPVAQFVLDAIRAGAVARCDKWYFNPFIIEYFVSRAYAAGVVELAPAAPIMIDRITRTHRAARGFGETPIENATAICTLLNFTAGVDLNAAVHSLLETQRSDGGWDREEVYRGGVTRWGSDAWTTAFCVEALTRARAQEP